MYHDVSQESELDSVKFKCTSNLQSQVPNPLCSPIAWLPPCSQGLLLSGKPTPIHSLPARPEKWPEQKYVLRKKSFTSSENIKHHQAKPFQISLLFSGFLTQKYKISAKNDTKNLHENPSRPDVSTALPHPKDNSPPESGESETRIYTSEFQGELHHLGVWEFPRTVSFQWRNFCPTFGLEMYLRYFG